MSLRTKEKMEKTKVNCSEEKVKNNLLLNNEIESTLYKPILEGDITLFGPLPKKNKWINW